jgi:OFA family oxalate/formate antiporter-like MFS transporter
MVVFYSILSASVVGLVLFGNIPSFFVFFVFLTALLGGSPFVLYPATIGDYYGSKFSTVNYGATYTAKAWAGLLSGWLTAYLASVYGSYKTPIFVVAILSLLVAILSSPKFLKPPRCETV